MAEAQQQEIRQAIAAYRAAESQYQRCKNEMASWKEIMDAVRPTLEGFARESGDELVTMNKRPAYKFVQYVEHRFNQELFKRSHPDLHEEFVEEKDRTRFTWMDKEVDGGGD